MPNLAILPTPLTRAAFAASRNPRNASTCGIYEIAGRLGVASRSVRWVCNHLDALVAGAGFPPPFPLTRAGALLRTVQPASAWPRVAVDAWFDGQLPPDAKAALGTAERVEVDSRLNTNLAHLFDEAVA